MDRKDKTTIPANIKCDCGHTIKDHYKGGWCHSSGHPKAGECGCTWFYPNVRYIKRKMIERANNEKLAIDILTGTFSTHEQII